jgi:restriction endonuclease Mrr
MRRHLESYRTEARIMGVIEQVARYDEHVKALRTARQHQYAEQIGESIRRLQRRGMVDPELDPAIAVTALGAMTLRFAELWLAEGDLDCAFDVGVDQITRLFLNGLRLSD